MKNHYLILLLLFPISVFSQINFPGGDLKSAFDQAKNAGKPLFIMIHADGCPHCEHFLKTFSSNSKIGDFYNTAFVNYSLEVNSEDGMAFRRNMKLNVMSTPLLTFWSADSTLLAIYPAGDAQNNETSILNFATRALDTQTSWPGQKQAFRSGYRQADFLVNLAYMSRYVSDESLNLEAMRAYGSLPETENRKDDGFLVLQKVIIDDEHPLFLHILNNREEYYSKYGAEEVNRALENVIMWSLYSERTEKFSLSKLKFMQAALKSLGIDEMSITGRFFLAETAYYFKNAMPRQAIDMLDNYCKKREKLEQEEITFLKKYYEEHLSDTTLINEATTILDKTTKTE